jgi:hypothetical protein
MTPSSPELAAIRDRIDTLRRLTMEGREIAEAVQCFHDQLVALEPFLALGHVAHDPLLEEIVQRVARAAGPPFDTASLRMTHVAEHGFWHGAACSVQGGLAVFFYFEELGVGIAHVLPSLCAGREHLLRFRGMKRYRAMPDTPGRRGQA